MRSLPFVAQKSIAQSTKQLQNAQLIGELLDLVKRKTVLGLATSMATFSRLSLSRVSLLAWTSVIMLPLAAPVYAYTVEELVTVSREVGEDYNALARRAEGAARAVAQQRFDSDILLTRVVITVLGQNGGQIAPILVLDVNRNDWRSRPDPQRWAKYYRSTPVLLELDGSAPPPASTAPALPPVPEVPPVPNQTEPSNTPTNAPQAGLTPAASSQPAEFLPSGENSPPSINIPAAPAGQVGLPRSILR